MNIKKSILAATVIFALAGAPALAQSITERGPDAPEKRDGLPGEAIDRDGDGTSEGRSFDGGRDRPDVAVEGHSESPSRDKPDGDTGVTVSLGWDF